MVALAAAALLLLSAAATPQKLEPAGPVTDKAVPEAVRSSLESEGVRVTLSGEPWCDLWLRKGIPDEKDRTPGALHGQLAVSTAVGVIRFLAPATDFRGQAIRPGFYTLRYALAPADASHLGVSEYPDFLLVVPAAEDSNPDTRFKFDDLMDLSRKATGTRHPGVLSLTRASGTSFPAVTTNDLGHVVLQVKGRLRSGAEAPIALVVKGHAEQ